MNNRILSGVTCVLLILTCPKSGIAASEHRKVRPPLKIEHNEKVYKYNPAWKSQEIYLEYNLDDEPDDEIILGFISTHKPEPPDEDETKSLGPVKKKEPSPSENIAFFQIYKMGFDGKYGAVKMISGMDRAGRVEIVDLDGKKPPALAIFSPGGEHYTDLSIFRWQEGGYRLLFNESSSGNITLENNNYPVTLRIGYPSGNMTAQEKPAKIFEWDPTIGTFKIVEQK